jgi:hypothetical protein
VAMRTRGRTEMRAAHHQSIRLLQGVLAASATLPALLFVYASWQGYDATRTVADRRIAQSRDILTEHALKVSRPSSAASWRRTRSSAT